MTNLRAVIDAGFWDLNISSARPLDGVARSVPGEPIPMDISRAGRFLRIQQTAPIRGWFPGGLIPHWLPTPHKNLGDFALQTYLGRLRFRRWWLGLVGQVRPKTLLANLKNELSLVEELDMTAVKDVAENFLEKSVYSIGLLSQIALTSSTSLLFSMEKHAERKGSSPKFLMYHQLPGHDITFEAAWPELFIDSKEKYWEVPESMSLDCSSVISDFGVRYRYGLHKNAGHPKAIDSSTDEAPVSLLQGFCAKAAISLERSFEFWREKETKEDKIIDTPAAKFRNNANDSRLKEPHASISGIIGATCASWFSFGDTIITDDSRSPFSSNMFGSGCFTYQHGKFRKPHWDLTRIDVKLNFPGLKSLYKDKNAAAANRNPRDAPPPPSLNLIFQQQIAGPLVFRVDSRLLLGGDQRSADVMFSLNYHLKYLYSGKVMAWYSPKRKEVMIELRALDF